MKEQKTDMAESVGFCYWLTEEHYGWIDLCMMTWYIPLEFSGIAEVKCKGS